MTAKYTREDIRLKAKELAKMMTETDEIDFFKRAEKKINENEKAQRYIAELRKLQKQAVHLQHYGKEEALKEVERKIEEIQDELDAIPLVQEFKQSQLDVNELLQMVSNTISRTITAEITASMNDGTSNNNCCRSC